MKTTFARLVRFKDTAGKIHYGEATNVANLVGEVVTVYKGDSPWNLTKSETQAKIAEVLCPLVSTPIIYGIGLNYKAHIEESGFPMPPCPPIFTKSPDALAGPFEDVAIGKECLLMDYEGELCFIIGRDCKNVGPDEDPSEYILGYTAGNDVSSRYWQMPERSGQQAGYSKSFDKFAPIGPIIASPSIVDPANLDLKTRVNGELRQSSNTNDLLHGVGAILHHLSRATTLRKGTVIMTGTPSGVAAFMKPSAWLKTDDIVEIEIAGIGAIRNVMKFEA